MTTSSSIYAYTLSGAATLLYTGSAYCLDVQPIEGQVAFTRQINQMVSGAADTNGCFWNHFFQLHGALYAIANANGGGGPMVIRSSTNNGVLWTYVNDPPTYSGHPFPGTAWIPGHTSSVKYGRLWMDAELATGSGSFGDSYIAAMSAPTNGSLLAPTNWSLATSVVRNTNWLGGTFSGWLEGNCLQDTNGGLVLMMRVDNRYPNGAAIGSEAAIIRINSTGGTNATTTFTGGNFDPTDPNGNGFVNYPGGCTRSTIRFDSVTQWYWTLCNYIPRAFRNNAYNAERFRSILALASSPNLRDWTIQRFVLFDDRLYNSDPAVVAAAFNASSIGYETAYGFQYADWQFDGSDLVATVRTSFCDNNGGPNSGHNSNFYWFTRVTNFRSNPGPSMVAFTLLQYEPMTSTAQISFLTRASYLYQLQTSSDLQNWANTSSSLEGNGTGASFSLSRQTAAVRYYRVAESAAWLP